jgi:hypothetical protein
VGVAATHVEGGIAGFEGNRSVAPWCKEQRRQQVPPRASLTATRQPNLDILAADRWLSP